MTARELFREGDWLGDYEIRGRLRAGGMATLFLAERHGAAGVSRPVVIKVIHPHLAEDELMVRMFIDEARISSHISHSNVVHIEEFGEHDGVYYIVMEYVDGCSLHQLLRALVAAGRRLSAPVAVHFAIEVAAGLHAAHETAGADGAPLGVVHRDVSPSNVLLTRDGRVKVIDFGIAKARGRLGGTHSGSGIKGKLRYMSPDQAWGRPIDRRADVYALGICLWELLTCRQLFRGAVDLAVLEAVRNPVIPPPSKLNPEVSAALDAVVLRATAKRAEDRHQTALELRRDLMAAVPAAVAIPPELVAEIVRYVCVPDRAATLEIGTTTFEVEDGSSWPTPASSEEAGVAARRPGAWRHRALVFAGVLGACAIGVAVAMASRPHEALRLSAPQPPPAEAIDAGVAPLPAVDASAAPAVETAGAPAIAPPPIEPPASKPPPRRAPHSDKPRVTTVEADGAVLADEPAPAPARPAPARPSTKPKAKPANAVRADDAVLAE